MMYKIGMALLTLVVLVWLFSFGILCLLLLAKGVNTVPGYGPEYDFTKFQFVPFSVFIILIPAYLVAGWYLAGLCVWYDELGIKLRRRQNEPI